MPELKTFYFTFGRGFPLADYTQVIRAPNEGLARVGMFRYYDNRWCGCYHADKVELHNHGNLVQIGEAQYERLAKVITAYDEDEIGCAYERGERLAP